MTQADSDYIMTPETIEAMRPIWEAAYEALRTDVGTLEDLARAAARAAAARDERIAQGVEVVTDGRPQRVLLTAAEKRMRKADAQRRYRAQKAAEKVEAERAAASAAKGAARAARGLAAREDADAQAAEVKPPRVRLSEEERRERRRESRRRYNAANAEERREKARAKRAAATPEERAERAAAARRWYHEHKKK